MQRKVRTPKRGVQVVEVTRRAQRNNGNIEIIPSGPSDPVRVKYEEMVINSKRYRVPEESIRVDFVSLSFQLALCLRVAVDRNANLCTFIS